MLNEMDGRKGRNGQYALEDLVNRLGSSWKSRMGLEGGSGGSQRFALVWDSQFAALDGHKEIVIDEKRADDVD